MQLQRLFFGTAAHCIRTSCFFTFQPISFPWHLKSYRHSDLLYRQKCILNMNNKAEEFAETSFTKGIEDLSNETKWETPEALKDVKGKVISILYCDDSIIVINKPSKLRSVPGHASPAKAHANTPSGKWYTESKQVKGAPPIGDKKRDYHATWALALKQASEKYAIDGVEMGHPSVGGLIRSLAALPNASVVPRKRRTFIRYCGRTNTKLIDFSKSIELDPSIDFGSLDVEKREDQRSIVEKIAERTFTQIYNYQRPMLNLPVPTADHESAYGQLRLFGLEPSADIPIKIVHRLDMETSGVMVFARNDCAASKLCEYLREREVIQKQYIAQVREWPPFHEKRINTGVINFPLSPSDERLKWKVDKDGKASETRWKVVKEADDGTVTLLLKPITGRTHQLRIHCATVGSGIIGDSLYGNDPVQWTEDITNKTSILHLHAHRLSFPHPINKKPLSFQTPPPW